MSKPSARRIHGRHPLLPEGGAAIDDDLPPHSAAQTAQAWLQHARRLVAAAGPVGVGDPILDVRVGHVTLALPAPVDARDAAADILDQVVSDEPDTPLSFHPDLPLRMLFQRAKQSNIPAFVDEDEIVLGMGRGARVWPLHALPPDVGDAHRIPLALVTGTNGKTTTANLLGAIATAAGLVPGIATSTQIRVGTEIVERGDWSGAGAARIVARDTRVELAVLETARGGLLRRGLLIDGADVAILTNISDDHLGDWGITTLPQLAAVKRIIAESVRENGVVITRADDPVLEASVGQWHPSRPDVSWLRFSSTRRADAWREGDLLRFPGGALSVREVPLTFGGGARHNVENALAAALAAVSLGLSPEHVIEGLRSVRPDPKDNPGRSNLFSLHGAHVLVDYAHNPDGLAVLGELADALRPIRRRMLLGQAGDRPEELVLALARTAASIGCTTYVLKPLPGYARGRPPEEVVGWLHRGLLAAGVPASDILFSSDEADGVRKLLDALQPGELGLLLVHEDLDEALSLLASAGAQPASV